MGDQMWNLWKQRTSTKRLTWEHYSWTRVTLWWQYQPQTMETINILLYTDHRLPTSHFQRNKNNSHTSRRIVTSSTLIFLNNISLSSFFAKFSEGLDFPKNHWAILYAKVHVPYRIVHIVQDWSDLTSYQDHHYTNFFNRNVKWWRGLQINYRKSKSRNF